MQTEFKIEELRVKLPHIPVFTLIAIYLLFSASTSLSHPNNKKISSKYTSNLLSEKPEIYWDFNEAQAPRIHSAPLPYSSSRYLGKVVRAKVGQAGPRPKDYPDFIENNKSISFDGKGSRIEILDPGADSAFDFKQGDTLSIEAWVYPTDIPDGRQVYVIGKGRTGRKGFPLANQNWSLRLKSYNGQSHLSFLFRNSRNRPERESGGNQDWHRWTSNVGFPIGDGWHQIAISYTFGNPKSIRGYIDGEVVRGSWDLGGATTLPPVVDDDSIWIGSSQGGAPSNSFEGFIDEISIFRKPLDQQKVKSRYGSNISRKPRPELPQLKSGKTLVHYDLVENVSVNNPWNNLGNSSITYQGNRQNFAWFHLPRKYNSHGIITDRSSVYLLRAASKIHFDKGRYQFLVRAYNQAKFRIDGKLLSQLRPKSRNADGHEAVPESADFDHPTLRTLSAGHRQDVFEFKLSEGYHDFQLEVQVGGKGLRAEIGELVVAFRKLGEEGQEGSDFQILSATPDSGSIPLTDTGWEQFVKDDRRRWLRLNQNERQRSSKEIQEHYNRRHQKIRTYLKQQKKPSIPGNPDSLPANNAIDHFINQSLKAADKKPLPLIDDYTFLRRVSLDIRGIPPKPEEIVSYFNLQKNLRRDRWIELCLEDPAWADRWVGYWQDVLAENPGLLKPKLNNTGPFRWWLHESFLDNKPMDRFVWELLRMEGSTYGGGTAGFKLATQNDVPMAAKAHIVGTAFLGVEMKCARCHDAPYHDYTQKNLFELASLLNQKPIKVPTTSSVPGGAEDLIIDITLKPGETVKPNWPFENLAPLSQGEFGDSIKAQRDLLSATITSPKNSRFAQVIVNRLWKVYMGRGLVESLEDWDGVQPSHPKLLEYLGQQFIQHGFDLKALSRQILRSHVYQRQVQIEEEKNPSYAGPYRKRLEAEQIVDTLFSIAEKDLQSEQLNLDLDGRRPVTTFLNLGDPQKAWEFTSLSNERDRPALAMPYAQSIIDVLRTFGWRESRQDPISQRESTMTAMKPLILANGTVSHRIVTLSEESAFTRDALEAKSVEECIQKLFLRILSRKPKASELLSFKELLSPGFEKRILSNTKSSITRAKKRLRVSWSNHLHKDATKIKLELEEQARRGDPPTNRLQADWRERCEDLVWALINSPEFLFVP